MSLREVNARWASCTGCALAHTRRRIVLGAPYMDPPVDGAPMILVIGEMPGPREDFEGLPFIGPAGQLLREGYLQAAGVRLAYLTGSVACYAARIRPPTETELTACAPRLAQQAEALQPAGAILVGRVAEGALGALTIPSVAVVHPSALLRAGHPSPGTEKKLKAQVAKIKRFLARLKPARAPKGSTPPSPQGHVHQWVPGGLWRGANSLLDLPLVACQCGTAEVPSWPRKQREPKGLRLEVEGGG